MTDAIRAEVRRAEAAGVSDGALLLAIGAGVFSADDCLWVVRHGDERHRKLIWRRNLPLADVRAIVELQERFGVGYVTALRVLRGEISATAARTAGERSRRRRLKRPKKTAWHALPEPIPVPDTTVPHADIYTRATRLPGHFGKRQ